MDSHHHFAPANRPRATRNRSQTYTITKSSNVDASFDSDASKRSSLHRHSHSHHHIPHPSRRLAKDILGLQNGSFALPELGFTKQTSKIMEATLASEVSNSRRGSLQLSGLDGSGQARVAGVNSSGVSGMSDAEFEKAVFREQWRSKIRESELRSTLQYLSDESMKTTRQLDDIYYKLLEKVSGLQSTINSLQELSAHTGQMHAQFRDGATALEGDVQRQIDGFSGFDTQRETVEALENRVKNSRKNADSLSEKLRAVKKRALRLEVREREWQDSVNWRLRWMWIVLGAVGGIILAVVMLHMYAPGTSSNAGRPSGVDNKLPQLNALNVTNIPPAAKSLLGEVLGVHNSTTVDEPGTRTRRTLRPGSEYSISSSRQPKASTTSLPDDASFSRIFDDL